MVESNTAPGAGSQLGKRGRGRPRGAKTGTGKKARARQMALANANAGAVTGGGGGSAHSAAGKSRTTGTKNRPGANIQGGQQLNTAVLSQSTEFFRGGDFRFAAEPWVPSLLSFAQWRERVTAQFNAALLNYQQYIGASANALTMTAGSRIS